MLRSLGAIPTTLGLCATTDTARRGKRLFSWRNQAIVTSNGRPLGKSHLEAIISSPYIGIVVREFDSVKKHHLLEDSLPRFDSPDQKLACALVTDHQLSIPAGVLAASVAKQWNIDVHVFVERPRELRTLIHEVKNSRVIYHYERLFSGGMDEFLPDHPRYSRAAWGRLFLPFALAKYKKILYLDIDIIPGRLPENIIDIDLPHGIGMVKDAWEFAKYLWKEDPLYSADPRRCSTNQYFNSGVLLLDPVKWDRDKVEFELKKFINCTDFHKFKFPDQDFLNQFFKNQVTELSPNLNFQSNLHGLGFDLGVDIAVRHFTRKTKPYHSFSRFSAASEINSAARKFREMASEAGLFLPHIEPYEKLRFGKILKNQLRLKLQQAGVRVLKLESMAEDWRVRRSLVAQYIEDGFQTGRFMDKNVFDLSPAEPSVRFDGFEMIAHQC